MDIKPGMPIFNSADPPKKDGEIALGSIGGFFTGKDNVQYLLTCYHCVYQATEGHDEFKPGVTKDRVSTFDPEGHPVEFGTIIYGQINHEVDAALVEVDSNFNIIPEIPVFQRKPGNIRLENTYGSLLPVQKYGLTTEYRKGTFQTISTTQGCPYPPNLLIHHFDKLLVIDGDGGLFADGGDSGSLILDMGGSVLGMVVLIDDDLITYGIPVSQLKKNLTQISWI
ncbi:hypothetical protein [Mucilaginibacter celer]|uniref:Trypsin-like peptidase domain-containing protein n=1 Tax=Mucilaginibacter celer TaxID=2305508 RepID=A0A494VHM4_9SPHI|nr:hypothetical protein [Mucilaginibacter celer]AYL94236.1 hypothetical protein HYN43_002530 [Mucilaginibacter celer]